MAHVIWMSIEYEHSYMQNLSIQKLIKGGGIMVFDATFHKNSVISWQSVLLVEETGVLGENYRSAASNWETLSYNVISSTPHHERDSNSQLKNFILT